MSSEMNATTPTDLTPWQKAQAAMLYCFTSVDYLKGLHKLVGELITGVVDPLLETAKVQGRDKVLVSQVWGDRNTSQNWENNAWPFLRDLQISLAKDIALRAAGKYRRTSVNESLRGVAEYSTDWATPSEERILQLALATISEYAAQYDDSVNAHENRWDDYCFAYVYPAFARLEMRTPKFEIREEFSADTGEVVERTGVYVALDDPYASLQFVWSGAEGIKLRVANTFNEIGLAALSSVGRKSLWFDEEKMFAFATAEPNRRRFHDLVYSCDEPNPSLAPSAVARSAFTSKPCRWALVDIVPGEFEEIDLTADSDVVQTAAPSRVEAGDRIVFEGYYITPSAPGARQFFSSGDLAPVVSSSYGKTIWQWDLDQNK
jgi:hypothetical protein